MVYHRDSKQHQSIHSLEKERLVLEQKASNLERQEREFDRRNKAQEQILHDERTALREERRQAMDAENQRQRDVVQYLRLIEEGAEVGPVIEFVATQCGPKQAILIARIFPCESSELSIAKLAHYATDDEREMYRSAFDEFARYRDLAGIIEEESGTAISGVAGVKMIMPNSNVSFDNKSHKASDFSYTWQSRIETSCQILRPLPIDDEVRSAIDSRPDATIDDLINYLEATFGVHFLHQEGAVRKRICFLTKNTNGAITWSPPPNMPTIPTKRIISITRSEGDAVGLPSIRRVDYITEEVKEEESDSFGSGASG